MKLAQEFNFDGIIGPTHNYAGLSPGNIASLKHKGVVSRPREAALQGLWKMSCIADVGARQAVLPPQERPALTALRRMGFTGSDVQIIERAAKEAPHLLAAVYSASSMWAANAATVSPSADTADGRVHFTVANLQSHLHRSLEAPVTESMLRRIFSDPQRFTIHSPLPATDLMSDEGAANHMRFAAKHGKPGVEVFVYGRGAVANAARHRKFPARQSLEACRAIARLHQLDPARVLFVQQNPSAIDRGVFHNDVVATSYLNVLVCHEDAYVNTAAFVASLRRAFRKVSEDSFHPFVVQRKKLPLHVAVKTYLFNSQLVSVRNRSYFTGLGLIYPLECQRYRSSFMGILDLGNRRCPIGSVMVTVKESMDNGGGPACLRLRVVLTKGEAKAMHQGVIWTPALNEQLVTWVNKHYREELKPDDLRDPHLIREGRDALDELTKILDLPGLYAFQK